MISRWTRQSPQAARVQQQHIESRVTELDLDIWLAGRKKIYDVCLQSTLANASNMRNMKTAQHLEMAGCSRLRRLGEPFCRMPKAFVHSRILKLHIHCSMAMATGLQKVQVLFEN